MSLANDGIGNRFENLVFFKERTEVIAPKSQLNTVFHIKKKCADADERREQNDEQKS